MGYDDRRFGFWRDYDVVKMINGSWGMGRLVLRGGG